MIFFVLINIEKLRAGVSVSRPQSFWFLVVF